MSGNGLNIPAMTRRGIERTLAGLAAVVGWGGLALQYGLIVGNMGAADGSWRFIAFFTILANVGTAIVASAMATGSIRTTVRLSTACMRAFTCAR